ncbi:MAG: GNAT family N-acetyltransferase [Bradymonadaceae bacterium]
MVSNEHIGSLGYRLEYAPEDDDVRPLLKASGLEPLSEVDETIWKATRYLVARTLAGGIAACVGWNGAGGSAVVHSLAVATSSRGSGIGASLLATAMGIIREEDGADAIFICTDTARRFFGSFGFGREDRTKIPAEVAAHPAFSEASEFHDVMVRRYGIARHGLDHCAFRLIHNTTRHATLPPGSVFLFVQSGPVLESSYRGGPVMRGHLIGAMNGSELRFMWHQYTHDGELMQGDGQIFVNPLEDGRRELREKLTEGDDDPGELLMREV